MNNKRYLCDIITASDCELMLSDIEAFSNDTDISDESKKHILSSVMRKAGFDMDNITNTKNTNRRSKRFVAFAAAAAITVTGVVSAGAAYVYKQNTASERYFGAGTEEKLESMGAKYEQTIKGEHFDINIEALLSDGQYLTAVANAVPNDDEGVKWLTMGQEPLLHQTESKCGELLLNGGANWMNAEDCEIIRWSGTLKEPQDKVTIPMSLVYYPIGKPDYITLTEFELTFEKNEKTVKLENASGEAITVSENIIRGTDVTIIKSENPLPFRNIKAEYKDGTTKMITPYTSDPDCFTEDNHYDEMSIELVDLIDVDNVVAITIGSTRFELKA